MAGAININTENPFHNFSSRHDVPETFNIERPNSEVEIRVKDLLHLIKKEKLPKILPILGEAGFGKTHFFHCLSENTKDAYVVYVPSPSNPNRIFSHLYFETIRAGGARLLDYISDHLVSKYKTADKAAFDFTGGGNIVIEIFFALKDPKISKQALKWLTGFDVDEDTFNPRHTILDDEELAFVALKIVLMCVDKPIIFYIDELESLFISLGPEAELQLLESLKKMYNEASNFLICLACLTTLWDKILELSSPAVQSRMETPSLLKRFTKKDIKEYAINKLKIFHKNIDVVIDEEQELWPLTNSEIESAYAYSHGNPREAIKWLANSIESKKAPISQSLEENSQKLNETGVILKKFIKGKKKLQFGYLLKNHGAFTSIISKEKRILVVVPPSDSLEGLFHKSFERHLKEVVDSEDYSDVYICENEGIAKSLKINFLSLEKLEDELPKILEK